MSLLGCSTALSRSLRLARRKFRVIVISDSFSLFVERSDMDISASGVLLSESMPSSELGLFFLREENEDCVDVMI